MNVSDDNNDDLTGLLRNWSAGDPAAADELFHRVYLQLKGMARAQLADERAGHTLQPTALVNEAYLKLFRGAPRDWDDRVHFFAVAARVIRQILVDHGRKRSAQRRSGGRRVTLDPNLHGEERDPIDILALDDALNRLAVLNETQAEVVVLRYFGGLTIEEAAVALNRSEATVNRHWRAARAWLYQSLSGR